MVISRACLKKNESGSGVPRPVPLANKELIELNNEKNHLIGILAHDLRNPLTSSLAIANNLSKHADRLEKEEKDILFGMPEIYLTQSQLDRFHQHCQKDPGGDLVQALTEGWISGAGLDVFSEERLPPDHPLLQSPKVVATPHVAFYSEESLVDLQRQAAENVALVLSGRKPPSILNPEVLELPRWAHLA